MLVNNKITIYHKELDEESRLEKWTRLNYDNAWLFRTQSTKLDAGYAEENQIEVRIPYNINKVDLTKIDIGDIIVVGKITDDIQTQQDLSNYEIYNITKMNNNNFGNASHLHLGGK